MAVATEFIDFIVPIAVIELKYPGGWRQCLEDHAECLGGRVWHDERLFRDGAMGPEGIAALVEDWTALGFEPHLEVNGQKHWKDFCVFEMNAPTLPCDWIAFDRDVGGAYLRGQDPGVLCGRQIADWD